MKHVTPLTVIVLALSTVLATSATAVTPRADEAARELCGDLYGTMACNLKLANRAEVCTNLVFHQMLTANAFRARGMSLKQAEVLLSEAEGIPERVTEYVFRHPKIQDDAEHLYFECLSGRDILASDHAPHATAPDTAPPTLIKLWHIEDEKCHGGFGNDPRTDAACAARDVYDAKLRALGWCYEYEGVATTDWHRCFVQK